MSSAKSEWIWSNDHWDYYRYSYNSAGQPIYEWASQPSQAQTAQTTQSTQPTQLAEPAAVEEPSISQQPAQSNRYQQASQSSIYQPQSQSASQYGRSHHYSNTSTSHHSYSSPSYTAGSGYDSNYAPSNNYASSYAPSNNYASSYAPSNNYASNLISSNSYASGRANHYPSNTSGQHLDSRYEYVRNPRAYFKKGRVFMTLVTEPGKWDDDNHEEDTPTTNVYGQNIFAKLGRFVVIRKKAGHSLCLPIHTYSGRATTKYGVNPNDHTALVRDGYAPFYIDGERLAKKPLFLKLEDPAIDISPASRVNFGKVTNFDDGIKVRTIGRIVPGSLKRLERYFRESIGVNNLDPSYLSDDDEPDYSYYGDDD